MIGVEGAPWSPVGRWGHRWLSALSSHRGWLLAAGLVAAAGLVVLVAVRCRRGRSVSAGRAGWVMLPTDSFGAKDLVEELQGFGRKLASTRAPSSVLTPSCRRAVRFRLTSVGGDLALCVEAAQWVGPAIVSALPAEVELVSLEVLAGADVVADAQVPAAAVDERPAPMAGVSWPAPGVGGGRVGAEVEGCDLIEGMVR